MNSRVPSESRSTAPCDTMFVKPSLLSRRTFSARDIVEEHFVIWQRVVLSKAPAGEEPQGRLHLPVRDGSVSTLRADGA